MEHTSNNFSLPTPSRCPEGQGMRRLDCRHYAQCLEVAAYQDWPGFTCQHCLAYIPDPSWRKNCRDEKAWDLFLKRILADQ